MDMEHLNSKVCCNCGKEKVLGEFYKQLGCKDGWVNECKACRRNKSISRYYEISHPSRRNYRAEVINGKKKCKDCGLEKPLEEFHRSTTGTGERKNRCKVCVSIKGRHPDPARRNCLAKIVNGKKRCKKCGLEKPVEEFRKHVGHKDGRTNTCKTCYGAGTKLAIAEFKKKVVLHKGGKCEVCGLKTEWYEVYDCHHLNPEEKEYGIAGMRYKDWDTIIVPELRKCILVCASCHSSLTSQIARLKPTEDRQWKQRYDDRANMYKRLCVEYIGNGCQICGLVTNDFAKYDFHHIDSFSKTYNIGKLRGKDWETIIQPELDKCALLCRNCHASVHYGRYDDLILVPGRRSSEEKIIQSASFLYR
jgi:hypothetical protein